jgi:hypothetical protein
MENYPFIFTVESGDKCMHVNNRVAKYYAYTLISFWNIDTSCNPDTRGLIDINCPL